VTSYKVALLNRCSVMSDDQGRHIMQALQRQVSHDFRAFWHIDVHLRFVPKKDLESWQGAWNLLLLDDSDEATALGYHDLTPEGMPVGKCFIKTDLKYGALPSVTVSHELLEMLLDPYINDYCYDPARGYFVAKEASDAVEADELGYKIGDVTVSDFVLPPFFDPSAAGRSGAQFSFCDNVHRPFALAEGGYEIIYVPGRGWDQNAARNTPLTKDRPKVGSRRERRMNRHVWERSLP